MSDLGRPLRALGLEDYVALFQDQGFETWEQLLDVTERDLETLGVKLGHRRRLQRAIQDDRLHSRQVPLELQLDDQSEAGSANPNDSPEYNASTELAHRPVQKRRYRRHPKACLRPWSMCTSTDDHRSLIPKHRRSLFRHMSSSRIVGLRDQYKGADVSFTNMAKIAGERWQNPDPEERAFCERQAQELKEDYYAKLAEYKETPAYARYQEYLADFKARHSDPRTQSAKRGRRSNDMARPASRNIFDSAVNTTGDTSSRSSTGQPSRSSGDDTSSARPSSPFPRAIPLVGGSASSKSATHSSLPSATALSDSSRSTTSAGPPNTSGTALPRPIRPWELPSSDEAPVPPTLTVQTSESSGGKTPRQTVHDSPLELRGHPSAERLAERLEAPSVKLVKTSASPFTPPPEAAMGHKDGGPGPPSSTK